MKLNSKTMRLILLGSVALSVIAFLAVLSLGSSVLSSKSAKAVDLKLQSQKAEAQLTNLEKAKKLVEKYSYFKEVAKTVIPTEKNQAVAVVGIGRMADASGLAIQSITFPASTLGLTTLNTGTAAQDATSASSSTTAISQAKPVSGIPGLYSLELTITPQSGNNVPPAKLPTFDKMIGFLNKIEKNRHTAQIASLVITPPSLNSTATTKGFGFILTINIFIKP